jgi:hypothetical protein
VTLASVILAPPPGSDWMLYDEGEWEAYHLVDMTRRPAASEGTFHRLCGSAAHTKVRVSVVMICAACMSRALGTKEGRDRL